MAIRFGNNILKIERLRELLDDDGRISFMGHCHDCKSDCTVSARALEDGIEIEGGAVYEPYNINHPSRAVKNHIHEMEDRRFLKCDACFGKNPTLTNYQDCEVYARVVGYLRPVKQFNEAKQAEFHDRVDFNIEGE
jgi:hypothetical protein